jgi:23S rRNA (uracil1939-C5)-methyltransferase
MTRVAITAMAHGGDGIGRIDGKTVFVAGAVENDVVVVDIVEEKKRFSRAVVREIIEPSPVRIDPPCPHFGSCGGCAWQQVPVEVQRRWKHETVDGLLRHIGRLDGVPVRSVEGPSSEYGYRNRMDFRTRAGRPTLFEAGSHSQVALDSCLLLHPLLADLFEAIESVDVPGVLTLRAGIRTGERAVVVDADAVDRLRSIDLPAHPAAEAVIHEVVGGRRFRISGLAFFQVNTEAAEHMAKLAIEAAGDVTGRHLVDAYAGGGLFGGLVGAGAGRVTAIESDPVAAADLAVNVGEADLIVEPTETGLASIESPPDVMVVDPPRPGMGPAVVEEIARLRPGVVVSVSCDPASFARDARLLVDRGYALEWVAPVDVFPQTPHIETVARFVSG